MNHLCTIARKNGGNYPRGTGTGTGMDARRSHLGSGAGERNPTRKKKLVTWQRDIVEILLMDKVMMIYDDVKISCNII